MTPTTSNKTYFSHVSPDIHRLFSIFDLKCPNLYRLHCSDSLRILNEIICLSNEYLNISPLLTMATNELLVNEGYIQYIISQIGYSSLKPKNNELFNTNKLHCFGQGIHSDNLKNQLHETSLFCFELTTKHNLSLPVDVIISDPNDNLILTDVKYINTFNQGYTKLFSCSYKPITTTGSYKVSFLLNNIKLKYPQYMIDIFDSTANPDSNFQKEERILLNEVVSKSPKEIPEYELEGDGCCKQIIVNSIARFRLRIKSSMHFYHNNSTVDLFSVSIIDPFGHSIVVQRRILSTDLLELTYQPMSIGEHQLRILFNSKVHLQLKIDVIHDELNHLSQLKPFGPGLQRASVGLPTEFYVDLRQTTRHDIHFRLEPSYQAEIDYEQQMATVRYIPLEEGRCPINILVNDKDISHSPFIAQVEKNIPFYTKPRVRVIDLPKEIILHRPVEFQVFVDHPFDDSNNSLHVDILTDDDESPHVSIRRRHRSSYLCSFTPITLGKHFISVDYASIVAENNPFNCQSIQEKDIELTGPAVNNQCLTLNEPTHFCFTLKNVLMQDLKEKACTYESGYSSNDDISSKSSSSTDLRASTNDDENNYHITITDGHGNVKPNILVKEIFDTKNDNAIRVDFTPDEKILYINISCTW